MPANKTMVTNFAKALLKASAPAPVKAYKATKRYSSNPKSALKPVSLAGHFMPKHARAILDIFAMTIRK